MFRAFVAFLTISLLTASGTCAQQKGKSKGFGRYHKIGAYEVYVPFAGQPNISPAQGGDTWKLISWQYAYPEDGDSINYLYGIEIFDSKDPQFAVPSKLEHLAKDRELSYRLTHGGVLIQQQSARFRGAPAIRQKVKVDIPNIGLAYVHSLYFLHHELVIRLFTFTPVDKDNNARITDFFESIKYKKMPQSSRPPLSE